MKDPKLGITRRSARVPLLRLTVTAGGKQGEVFDLPAGEHMIGSTRQAPVHLKDEGIERRHALLHVELHRAKLEALPGKVGTFLNGARLGEGPAALASGDEVEIGGAKLLLELLDPPPEPPPTKSTGRRRPAESSEASDDSGEAPPVPRRRVTSASVRGKDRQVTKTAAERPSFGSDQTAVFLANFFRVRPKMKFDFGLLEKARTHGYYVGDGSDDRKLDLGWEPIHVLFVEPAFAQLGRGWPSSDDKGNFREIGPHPQPELVEDGFVVGRAYNENGLYYRYVAFREGPYVPGPAMFSLAPG